VLERSLGHLALDDPAAALRRKVLFEIQRAFPRFRDG
jgi:hypothetical protein